MGTSIFIKIVRNAVKGIGNDLEIDNKTVKFTVKVLKFRIMHKNLEVNLMKFIEIQ